jgi:hypothetical protein
MHEHTQLAELLIQERRTSAQRPENLHRRELNMMSRRRAGRRRKRSGPLAG